MTTRRKLLCSILPCVALGALVPLSESLAQAQPTWPTPGRTIRIIVPSAPGSGTDILSRAFANYLQGRLKQTVIIDSKPGGNTIVGAEAGKNATPDGYSFFNSTGSTHSANPALYAKLPYDPGKDFIEVGLLGTFPYLALVKKDSPYRNIADLIAAAKAKPGAVNYGYSGSSSLVPLEMLKSHAGVNIVPISYKAAPAVVNDIAAGIIDFAILAAISGRQSVQNGLLRPAAVTSTTRLSILPDVQAVAETLPGFQLEGWVGISAPVATPRPIVEAMNRYVRDSLTDPLIKRNADQLGVVLISKTVAEQNDFANADRKRWADLIRSLKIPEEKS